MVLNGGMSIIDDPSQAVDKKHKSKLPGIVGWNLVWLTTTYVKNMGQQGLTVLHV